MFVLLVFSYECLYSRTNESSRELRTRRLANVRDACLYRCTRRSKTVRSPSAKHTRSEFGLFYFIIFFFFFPERIIKSGPVGFGFRRSYECIPHVGFNRIFVANFRDKRVRLYRGLRDPVHGRMSRILLHYHARVGISYSTTSFPYRRVFRADVQRTRPRVTTARSVERSPRTPYARTR